MEFIEIRAIPDDLLKLRQRVASFGPPKLVRCQVAGDDVWTCVSGRTGWSPGLTEIRAATQVDGWIDKRPLAKVGVSACGVIEVGRPTAGVAAIAITRAVDYITAQSNQRPVFPGQIQGDGRYLETPLDD